MLTSTFFIASHTVIYNLTYGYPGVPNIDTIYCNVTADTPLSYQSFISNRTFEVGNNGPSGKVNTGKPTEVVALSSQPTGNVTVERPHSKSKSIGIGLGVRGVGLRVFLLATFTGLLACIIIV